MAWNGFYKGKKVLITGHTGFKGSWLCQLLLGEGAEVTGYALEPPTTPSLFELCYLKDRMNSVIGDIRDLEHLMQVFERVQPEIVIHMAAQPLVRESYNNPVYTYDVNVMGTVNVLECVRRTSSVKSFLNVTTDKVYLNREWERGYKEEDELNGYDPYSNSKSCSELITSSYIKSFLDDMNVAVSTARAGNVIGGGDFAMDRIIPDCVRAVSEGQEIIVRNPYSVRPFQHVLEPLVAYLMICAAQYEDGKYAGSYNIGPDESDCINTGRLADIFCQSWSARTGKEASWKNVYKGGPHEAQFLKVDCTKFKSVFGWQPKWSVEDAISKIVEWSVDYLEGRNVSACMDRQIEEYTRQV